MMISPASQDLSRWQTQTVHAPINASDNNATVATLYGNPGGKQQTANIRNVGLRDASYQYNNLTNKSPYFSK